MLATLLFLAAPTLPPVIADPRRGPSSWALVRADAPPPEAEAAGYLLELPPPPGQPDQRWLETAVALSSRRAPLVAMGSAVPPPAVLPYLDGFCPEFGPEPRTVLDLLSRLSGVALVVAASDPAQAVAVLSAGASAVLIAGPDPAWEHHLAGLLPEPRAARGAGRELPTALRSADLATVVGLPRDFPAGDITLPGAWYGQAVLVAGGSVPLALRRVGDVAVAAVPALPAGGVLVVLRPVEPGSAFENVKVSGERLPSAAEVLARHQRAAARQERLIPRWRAEQRLLVRVWVAQLSRSFEVVLAGPAFWERGVGTDWELARAWVDGVSWDPDALPDLPLLEPKRPPVPPLALRLSPSYRYELRGVEQRQGRRCFVLTFGGGEIGGVARSGTAFIDAESFGLVELEESAERLPGEVHATRSVTIYHPMEFAGELLWLPSGVTADDFLSAFGGTATVHRELELSQITPNPEAFTTDRGAAYARPHRMLRDAPGGIAALVPDGRGGRAVGAVPRLSQRFLIGGVVFDPGLSFPVPFGGLQVQDFNFRGRDEQLRLLLAGVVNDGAWSARRGSVELSARAFVQLLPFSSGVFVRGREVKGEEIKVLRQSIGAGAATTVGFARVLLDVGVDRWDFSRADTTALAFALPSDTFEGVAKLEGSAVLGAASLVVAGEAGWRQEWRAWGIADSETPQKSWRRGHIALVYEKALFPLAKLHLDGEYWFGSNLDRFSAPSPARFGGVRIVGIASNQVVSDRLAVTRAALALPLSARVRGQVELGLGWARDRRSGYSARPLSGVGVGLNVPGPWGTLLQGSIGFPLATPGPRRPTFELFLLRPLAQKQ
jgi:hypothetical protein